LDLIERIVYCAGRKIELSSREFDILEYFLRRPGRVITRAMLLQDVWKYHFSIETNVVDTHISNLRKKIDTHGMPSRILNIRKAGYMLRVTHISRDKQSG
jgi:two-component system, OmpR family, response regulator